MAKIIADERYALDLTKTVFSYFVKPDSLSIDRGHFGTVVATRQDMFFGTNVRVNPEDLILKSGTITAWSAFKPNSFGFQISGINVSGETLIAAIRSKTESDDKTLIASWLSGADKFTGGNKGDVVKLYAGNDVADGGAGNDKLYGGAGADTLIGGLGADFLAGGSGADTFVYRSVSESKATATGRDTIDDFNGKSGDRIKLNEIDANTKISGNQAFAYIGTDGFHGKAGELRYVKTASDTYIYGDVNGDKKADFSVHLDDAVTLQKGYFVL